VSQLTSSTHEPLPTIGQERPMYVLVLGAVLLSLCIVAVERRRGSPAGA
jgi:hypothetical protein